MSYQYPVCNKVSHSSLDLTRHMLGLGYKVHREWTCSKDLKYSELLLLQIKSFGGEGFKKLAGVLEKETKIEE